MILSGPETGQAEQEVAPFYFALFKNILTHLFILQLFTIFVALDMSYCVGGIQVQQQPEQSWRNLEMGDL